MMKLWPLQRLPAGHVVQVSRFFDESPVVNEPAAQVRHSLALPACEYLLSAPQLVHVLLPALLKEPLGHVRITLLPSQREPAGQREHALRVLAVPPVVYEPAAHVEHAAAPATLNLSSAPHAVQTDWPAGE